GQQRPALLALGAGALLLLMLACANVANLTLGHLAGRRAELTMRTLLGASRWRLIQQQLVQSLIVSSGGGALGLAIVVWSLPALLALYTRDGSAAAEVRIDWRVLAFAAAAIVASGVLSGAVPALRFQRTSENGVGGLAITRIGPGRREHRIRGGLVVFQVAMAVALLCAAGTLIVSLERLLAAPPGFDADRVLTLQLLLPPAKYGDVRSRAAFVQQMVERVSLIPGVVSAGTTQTTFMPNESMQTGLYVEGRPIDPAAADTSNIRHVTAGYFRTLRVPVVEGRAIDDRDRPGSQSVCMVSADFARQFWPRESAIGHRVRRLGATAAWMTIVGVAADVMDAGAGVKPGPTLYVPYLQNNTPTARVTLVAWTRGDPLASASAVRQAIWSIDPNQPVDRVGRLNDLLVTSAGDQRFRTMLLGIFAVSGLLLALVGVYGVTAASVAAQRWEAGVRLALGARPGALVMKMLRETTASVAAGAIAGAVMFIGFGRLLADLLYQTAAIDPRMMTAALTLMIVGAIAAAWLQARHIAQVSPAIAMRQS
ncbi:MAG TPA: FtsX-like permease family protein, partial [Vicinamibacterales bacterium]|nr:FtsX-like permease family protein [Vicinamibacterales bacterium]